MTPRKSAFHESEQKSGPEIDNWETGIEPGQRSLSINTNQALVRSIITIFIINCGNILIFVDGVQTTDLWTFGATFTTISI